MDAPGLNAEQGSRPTAGRYRLWSAADDAVRDPAFASAVGVFGSHYVCGYRGAQTDCPSSNGFVADLQPHARRGEICD
jgi:hypothetical protein